MLRGFGTDFPLVYIYGNSEFSPVLYKGRRENGKFEKDPLDITKIVASVLT